MMNKFLKLILTLLFFTKVNAQDTVNVKPSLEYKYKNEIEYYKKKIRYSKFYFSLKDTIGKVPAISIINDMLALKREHLVYFKINHNIQYKIINKKLGFEEIYTSTLYAKMPKQYQTVSNDDFVENGNHFDIGFVGGLNYFEYGSFENSPHTEHTESKAKLDEYQKINKPIISFYKHPLVINSFVVATQVDSQKNVELYLISCNFIKNNLKDVFKMLAQKDSLTADNVKKVVDLYFSPIRHDSIVIKKFDTKKIILTTSTDEISKKKGRVDCQINIKKDYSFNVKVRDKKSLVYAYFDIMKQCAKRNQ